MPSKKTAPEETAVAVVPVAYNWQMEKLDEDSGELTTVNKYKYIPGNPRDYRTDMRGGGGISINGTRLVELPLVVQPLAWRGFTSNLFDMGEKNWVEVAFIDPQNAVSMILFHGFSADAFLEMLAPLEYDDLKLSDVLLKIELIEHENKTLKTKYAIAKFSYEAAPDKERTKELKAYAREHKLYRNATIKEDAVVHFSHRMHNPND